MITKDWQRGCLGFMERDCSIYKNVDQILEGVDRGPKKVENWLGVSKPAISISPGRREVRWGL